MRKEKGGKRKKGEEAWSESAQQGGPQTADSYLEVTTSHVMVCRG